MNSFRSFQEDDEDDSHLFTKAEQFVLKNHPNPDRIGCPGPATLRRFVESPGQVELSEMNDLHVMTCAECTRDLIELRRERQIALKETSLASRTRQRFNWSLGVVAASICFVAVGLFVTTRRDPEASQVSAISTTVPVATMVDLSVDGVSRGAEERSESPVALPRKLLDLHIRLPYFSPSGSYRIFLSKQKDRSSSIVSATAAATVNGSKTDLQIRLDLSKLSAGDYFLGTQRAEDESANFYAVSVN